MPLVLYYTRCKLFILILKYCLIKKISFTSLLGNMLYVNNGLQSTVTWPHSEIFIQEQSYSSVHSGRSLAWDYLRGDIDDPCGVIADFFEVIADFFGVIADFCGVVATPEAIGGLAVGDADRCATH